MIPARMLLSLTVCKPSLTKLCQIGARGMRRWQVDTLRLMRDRNRDFDAISHKERHRREWIDWNYDSELYSFGKRLNEDFPMDQLRVAFTDKSYVDQEVKKRKELGLEDVGTIMSDNQELAQKGNKIMSDFVKSYLRYFLPRAPEECIRSIENMLSLDSSLSYIGQYIGCKELILSPLVKPTDEMIATSVKSLIGLLHQEKGSNQCQKFIIDIILPYLQDKDLLAVWDIQRPEIVLRKILKNDNLPNFEPRLLRETGRNTIFACYMVGLYVDKNLIGYGSGETVPIAQEMAAYDALRRFFQLTVPKVLFKFGPGAHNLDYKSKKAEQPWLNDWRLSDFIEKSDSQELSRKIAISM